MAPSSTEGRVRSFRKGLLAHLILVPAWTTAPAVLLAALVAVGAPRGWRGILASLGLGAGLAASTNMAQRAPLCLILIGVGAAAPTSKPLATGAALVATLLAYMCKGGCRDFKRRPWVWEFISRWRADYYQQAELRGEIKGIKAGKSCFAFHPHGCLAAGFTINGCWNPDFIKLAGKVNWLCDYNLRFKNPFFRVMCDAARRDDWAILGADKKSFMTLMDKGESVAFIPGGFQDAVAFQYGKDCTVLKKRKGFIKYCLQYGYRLHPVYTFGESETYYTFTGLRGLRMKISEQNIPMIAFFGWPVLPFLPRPQSRILTYVGPGLDLPKLAEPTAADVDKWHGEYVKALTKLFNDNRAEAGWPKAELEIV